MGRRPSQPKSPPPKEIAPVVAPSPVTPAEQPTTTAEPIEIHAVIPDEVVAESSDGLVAVRYFDGSTFTFDLHVAEGVANFVDGMARVTPALAKALREGGYVEEA